MAKMGLVEKWFVNRFPQYLLHKFWGALRFLRTIDEAEKQENILEIGCGIGMTSSFLAKKFPASKIIATDFDEEQIEKAKQLYQIPNIEFRQADATNLQFADNSFDACFSFLVFHHIENFTEAIKEIHRVLKPGGRFYILDIPSKTLNLLHLPSITPGVFSKSEFASLITDSGFRTINIQGNLLFKLETIKQ